MMIDFSIAYDDASMLSIAKLSGFQQELDLEVSKALIDVAYGITQQMVANTWNAFANPSGNLASSITYTLSTPLEAIITVDAPYAKRMELGFHGTDSLGRHFDEDGKPYAQPAFDDYREEIESVMRMATANTISAIRKWN